MQNFNATQMPLPKIWPEFIISFFFFLNIQYCPSNVLAPSDGTVYIYIYMSE